MTFIEFAQAQIVTVMGTFPWFGSLVPGRFAPAVSRGSSRQDFAVSYQATSEDATKLATDPTMGLVLVHWSIPHPPGIYNRFRDDFSYQSESNYFDNLELLDRTIGMLRRKMEAVGLWEGTTVLISSDHWWRTDIWSQSSGWTPEEAALAGERDRRVPFLLKMAGQSEGITYEPPFNTVVSHDLILAILRGELATPDDVVRWLDQRRFGEGTTTQQK